MKKILFLLFLLILTGCSVVRIDTSDINTTIDVVLSKNNNLYNQVGKGYKYYVPRGISYISSNEYNDILLSEGNSYYLFVDIVSYYNQIKTEYVINENAYVSRTIDINDKTGYLEINIQENGLYFVEFMYNYSKIETLVSEDDIEDVILYSSYILSTVKYNSDVIKLVIDEEFWIIEESYDIFTAKKQSSGFLKLEEEVVE